MMKLASAIFHSNPGYDVDDISRQLIQEKGRISISREYRGTLLVSYSEIGIMLSTLHSKTSYIFRTFPIKVYFIKQTNP